MRIRLLVLTLAVLGATSCGQVSTNERASGPAQQPTETSTEPPPAYDAGPPLDWDNLIGGTRVPDLTALLPAFPFSVDEPSNLGAPVATFVKAADESSGKLGAVQFVYDSPSYGRVVVIEHLSDLPHAKAYAQYMEGMAALNGTPELQGTAEIVTLANGQQGLFETSPDGSYASIYWYVESPQGNYEVMVYGPKIGRADAVAIADGL